MLADCADFTAKFDQRIGDPSLSEACKDAVERPALGNAVKVERGGGVGFSQPSGSGPQHLHAGVAPLDRAETVPVHQRADCGIVGSACFVMQPKRLGGEARQVRRSSLPVQIPAAVEEGERRAGAEG